MKIKIKKNIVHDIDVNLEYCCIGYKDRRGEFQIWRDVIFKDEEVARFYLDQEILAYERKGVDGDIPEKICMSVVPSWKIRENKNIAVYELPQDTKVMMEAFYFEVKGILIPVTINDDDIQRLFYSGRFGLVPNDAPSPCIPEHCANKVTDLDDYAMFGIRMRPLIQSPRKKNVFSMCGSGLPGLWYISIGERKEKEIMPLYLDTI